MPREILRITPELVTAYGIYNSGGAAIDVDLPTDNAFTMRPSPAFWAIPSAAADNLIVQTGTSTCDLDGSLALYCRPAEAAALMAMFTAPIPIPGACSALPSYSIDHGIFIEDGNCLPQITRYLGNLASGSFDLSNQGDGWLMLLKLKLMASSYQAINSTAFPTPLRASYDVSASPFTFGMLSGSIVYEGTDISGIVQSLSFDINNQLKPLRGANKFRTKVLYRGRRPTITMKLYYTSQQPRVDFNANSAASLVLTFTDALLNTLVINFGATNFIRQLNDDLHLGDVHTQTMMLMNTVDPATGTDMIITYTPHS